MTRVVVTGGAGYIGSHTCIQLSLAGFEVSVVDNFANSSPQVIDRISRLTGAEIDMHVCDVRDEDRMTYILREASAVVHFAARKIASESLEKPADYYSVNVGGTAALLAAMAAANCNKLVFSSSAAVYGIDTHFPISEDHSRGAINPYGLTKQRAEEIIEDVCRFSGLQAVMLRYFNPVGAHPSAEIGESLDSAPGNLMPYILRVASGQQEALLVHGDDYDTRDGTGVRDYIHVMDVAEAHCAAVRFLDSSPGCIALNVGTGCGHSVLEVIEAFTRVTGRQVPHRIGPRRGGDVPELWADPSKAKRILGWAAEKNIDEMCRDAWEWCISNPHGYADDPGTL